MKKTRKDKIYSIIGRAVTYTIAYMATVAISINALVYVVCNCCTTIK